ncbi:MAG: hypothetical protein LDL13_01755 [Calditerrivibrio sp.]|nr:hypothetical protein [Calditerrivibrio sp.]MCA1932285.1 hypothetical protein [Calditerrivibrio sp.]
MLYFFKYYLIFSIGISATIFFVRRFSLGPVGGASLTMILAGISENYINLQTDYANIFVVSAFIGMSSENIINQIKDILLIGIISSICYINFYSYFKGVGGSLGMCAFVSVSIFYILKNVTKTI